MMFTTKVTNMEWLSEDDYYFTNNYCYFAHYNGSFNTCRST